MHLREFEGKELFRKYNIPVPNGQVVLNSRARITVASPLILKTQVFSGDRMKAGGIVFSTSATDAKRKLSRLFNTEINQELPETILIEEKVSSVAEYYVSLSYDTMTRGPVLALSTRGGTGVSSAKIFPINMAVGLQPFFLRQCGKKAGFPSGDLLPLAGLMEKLWKLFLNEYALLAEINPLLKTASGQFVAADAKVILDDEKLKPAERRFLTLGGDIAILASGGGASLLNIDALLLHGGRPANYTEYSGNPPASVVKILTKHVLSQSGLKGCWVVGGTANFTDIYETMCGFVAGLREVKPKPNYPFVIRRDGPRQQEAIAMLKATARKEGFQFHIFGSETPMSETAKIMVEQAYTSRL